MIPDFIIEIVMRSSKCVFVKMLFKRLLRSVANPPEEDNLEASQKIIGSDLSLLRPATRQRAQKAGCGCYYGLHCPLLILKGLFV